MSRVRMYPTPVQAEQMLLHCAHARYVWNLAVEQHSHGRRWRKPAPGFASVPPAHRSRRSANGWAPATLTCGSRHSRTSPRRQERPLHLRVRRADLAEEVPARGLPCPRHRPGREDHGRAVGRTHSRCPALTTRERAQIRKHQRRAARAKEGDSEKTAEHAKIARLKAREADRRKDWCEKTSTMLARSYDLVRFEKLHIKTMTAKAKPKPDQPGQHLKNGRAAKAGLNRAILAQGWGLLRQRTEHKASAGSKTYRPVHEPAVQRLRNGSTRTRARAKPSSSASPVASLATRTPTRVSTSRRTGRDSPSPANSRCRRDDTAHQAVERP